MLVTRHDYTTYNRNPVKLLSVVNKVGLSYFYHERNIQTWVIDGQCYASIGIYKSCLRGFCKQLFQSTNIVGAVLRAH